MYIHTKSYKWTFRRRTFVGRSDHLPCEAELGNTSGSRSIYIRYTMARLDEVRMFWLTTGRCRVLNRCFPMLASMSDGYLGWWEWLPWMLSKWCKETSEAAFSEWSDSSLFKGKSPVDQLLILGWFSSNLWDFARSSSSHLDIRVVS